MTVLCGGTWVTCGILCCPSVLVAWMRPDFPRAPVSLTESPSRGGGLPHTQRQLTGVLSAPLARGAGPAEEGGGATREMQEAQEPGPGEGRPRPAARAGRRLDTVRERPGPRAPLTLTAGTPAARGRGAHLGVQDC